MTVNCQNCAFFVIASVSGATPDRTSDLAGSLAMDPSSVYFISWQAPSANRQAGHRKGGHYQVEL